MGKKVGIIQSSYLPWRGYFDFINEVDLFIMYDDVQYSKGEWRNRNLIKTNQGLKWITVPVHFDISKTIDQTEIDYSQKWLKRHLVSFEANYRRAPFYELYINSLSEILNERYKTISKLNIKLINWICRELGIKTPILMSRDLQLEGSKTDRLIDALKKVGASSYLSGPKAKDYLEEDKFAYNSIGLEYKVYDYPEYPQFHGEFAGNVSIIDLLFHCGPDSKNYIQSLSPNEVIIP